jgi:hypothetical protein
MARAFYLRSSKSKKSIKKLASDIHSNNIKVWCADFEFGIGNSITAKIEEAVKKSDFLVVVLGKTSPAFRWVIDELEAISEKLSKKGQSVTMLPVILDNCDIPLFIRSPKYADYEKEPKETYDKFISIIRHKIEKNNTKSPNKESNDKEGETKFNDVEFHKKIKDPRFIMPLINVLKDENWNFQEYVTSSMREIGDSAVKQLANLFKDKDWQVRMAVAMSMGKIGNPCEIKQLIEILDDDIIKEFSMKVLKKLTGRDLGNNPLSWERWWKKRKF